MVIEKIREYPIECFKLPDFSFEIDLSYELTILTTLFSKTRILMYRLRPL